GETCVADSTDIPGSVFMCRLCNLFSPSRSQLLAHCSKNHPQHESPDSIITALQPLITEPVEKLLGKSTMVLRESRTSYLNYQDGALGRECRICHRTFSNKRQILKHICLREEDEEDDVQQHGKDRGDRWQYLPQSKLKIFACEFCNKIFKFRHSLVAHLRTHTKEKPFQCPHCDYASAIKANLNVHLRKHTGEKFSCDHCAFSCLSPGHLKVHIERVHLKMKQHCSFCVKKYSDVKNLLKHMETRHNLKDSAVLQTYQQLRLKTRQGLRQLLYHCPTCNRRFKNQQERERHLLIHGPQPPFACLLCDHTATKMVALTAHVRKHLFLYVCSVCNKKLVSSQRLRGHLEESHPELDMEQTFINCINISYYLILPEGGGGSEEAELRNDGKQQQEEEQTQSVQMMAEEKGKEDRLSIGGAQKDSQNKSNEAAVEEKLLNSSACVSAADANAEKNDSSSSPDGVHSSSLKDRTQENTQPDVVNSSAVSSTASSSSSGVSNSSDLPGETHSSSASQVESSQTSPTEKVHLEIIFSLCFLLFFCQSAFEQVFLSLQKTRLDMETYQRLRKIYGDLECQYCGKLFWYKVHYNVHVRTHTKEHLHYCSKCSYSSITKSSLKRHQIQKHSGLLLPCSSPGCKYSTPDKYKLQAHMRTQHEQVTSQRRSAVLCKKMYDGGSTSSMTPITHLVVYKGPMVQRAEKCPYCDSYFLKNSSDFQQHIWAHQGLKPYVCSVCSYSSCNRSNLKTHMNRHSSEKHHLCDHCGKKFKSKLTLKSHRLNHTDEGKKFQCSECPFTSVFRPSLLRHMEQHAKFKPFRCAHCHYSCNIAGALRRHFNIKHPEETYENAGPGLPNSETLKQQGGMKCPECEFVYGTKWELTRHLKTKHNLKVVEGNWEVGSIQTLKKQNNNKCLSDGHGLDALTVLTQGENTHHYIVYIQEQTVEIN
uniref:Zinc finger and AT-hook domain containing n=1 Tax=Poecilia reticulata TaxID=8081 RepID=A0A3P9NY40_POERE